MDLQVTIPMLKLSNRKIQVLHLESTDVCNAACPLCARETDVHFDKDQQHHLTVEQIATQFDQEFISGLDKMFICGNYGDPAAGKHTLDIFRYFRQLNPTITLGMNTNGSLRTHQWWQDLAGILNQPNDYVIFSIDGFSETNPVYRVNTDFDKIVENVSAFIQSGGSAHWDMLVYKHNQHEVELAEQFARSIGFKWFRAKVSKRPFTEQLEFPVNWVPAVEQTGPIDCFALKEHSIYMDAQARISPCCWLGSTQIDFIEDVDAVQNSWTTNKPNAICKSTCGTHNNKTNFTGQWQREVQLC